MTTNCNNEWQGLYRELANKASMLNQEKKKNDEELYKQGINRYEREVEIFKKGYRIKKSC